MPPLDLAGWFAIALVLLFLPVLALIAAMARGWVPPRFRDVQLDERPTPAEPAAGNSEEPRGPPRP